MAYIQNFACQNWTIVPVALALRERPPADALHQKWMIVLSGVNIVDFQGNSGANWRHLTFSMLPDIVAPMQWAAGHYGLAPPAGSSLTFAVELWAPFATLNAFYDKDNAVNAGFAVDAWRPTPFATGTDVTNGQRVGNIFQGIDVDIAVRDTDAWLYRVGYHITLTGRIVPQQVIIG